MIKNLNEFTKRMKRASITWDELAKWVIFILLAIILLVVVVMFFSGSSGIWERIASVLRVGAG